VEAAAAAQMAATEAELLGRKQRAVAAAGAAGAAGAAAGVQAGVQGGAAAAEEAGFMAEELRAARARLAESREGQERAESDSRLAAQAMEQARTYKQGSVSRMRMHPINTRRTGLRSIAMPTTAMAHLTLCPGARADARRCGGAPGRACGTTAAARGADRGAGRRGAGEG
jgi:hypothetical protein